VALSPLDLQTSIGHTHDVARVRHLENEQTALLQHNLDAKSLLDSEKQKDTVAEAPKGEEIPSSLSEGGAEKRKREGERRHAKDEGVSEPAPQTPDNPLLGSHIDVTR